MILLQEQRSPDRLSCTSHKLDTDFLPRPRGLRQFSSNDFRRAGENNRATKSESLQNPEQPFKQVDTAQFGQGVGRIRDQDWQGIVHPLRLTIPLRSANFGDSLGARRLVLAVDDPAIFHLVNPVTCFSNCRIVGGQEQRLAAVMHKVL